MASYSSPLSSKWSWWWESTSANDQLAKSTLTIYLLILAVAWLFWISAKRSAPGLPPGPRGVPLLGNLAFLHPELHLHFAHLAKAHGPIFKLWLGNKLGIVITSPSLAKQVLKDHDVTFANRDVPAAARVIAYGGSDIVWTPYGPEWRMLRKVCVREMLSGATLHSVYALRRREMRSTVAHVYRSAGSPINVGEQMFLTILNVITSMLWGGTMEGEERNSLGAEFRQVVSEITDLLGRPNVSDFFPSLARFDLLGIQKQMEGPLARFDRIFEVIIDQRLKMDKEETEAKSSSSGKGESRDFLQFLLKLTREQTPRHR
ncbi:hypothetical protein ACLOJK_005413 [Asimina triloba]